MICIRCIYLNPHLSTWSLLIWENGIFLCNDLLEIFVPKWIIIFVTCWLLRDFERWYGWVELDFWAPLFLKVWINGLILTRMGLLPVNLELLDQIIIRIIAIMRFWLVTQHPPICAQVIIHIFIYFFHLILDNKRAAPLILSQRFEFLIDCKRIWMDHRFIIILKGLIIHAYVNFNIFDFCWSVQFLLLWFSINKRWFGYIFNFDTWYLRIYFAKNRCCSIEQI